MEHLGQDLSGLADIQRPGVQGLCPDWRQCFSIFKHTHRSEAEHPSLWHREDTDMAGHSHWPCTVFQGSLLFLLGWQAEGPWSSTLGTLSRFMSMHMFMESSLPAWHSCPNPGPPRQTHGSPTCWLVQMEVCWWWPRAPHLHQVWEEHRHCVPAVGTTQIDCDLWFYCSNQHRSPHLPHSSWACPGAGFGNTQHFLPGTGGY